MTAHLDVIIQLDSLFLLRLVTLALPVEHAVVGARRRDLPSSISIQRRVKDKCSLCFQVKPDLVIGSELSLDDSKVYVCIIIARISSRLSIKNRVVPYRRRVMLLHIA